MNLSRKGLFPILGRLLSCVFFALGLLVFRWPPGLILLGFWWEEVLGLISMNIKTVALHRRMKEPLGSEFLGGCVVFMFPFVHLIFIVVFLFMDGARNSGSQSLASALHFIARGRWSYVQSSLGLSLAELFLGLLAWTSIDIIKALRRPETLTLAGIAKQMKAALVLPHFTIIAGGFLMMMLRVGNWMAVGLIISKCIFELLLLPGMEKEAEAAERVQQALPSHSVPEINGGADTEREGSDGP